MAVAVGLSLAALHAPLMADLERSPKIQLGVYYYPGWSPNIRFSRFPDPWAPIKVHPGLLPLKGAYRDDKPQTLRLQLDEMKTGGLSFVVFDWYLGSNATPRQTQALNAFQKIAAHDDPKFAIMWANHDDFLKSFPEWKMIVRRWISQYFSDNRYLLVDDKPIIFIFSADHFEESAKKFGYSSKDLIEFAQSEVKKAGMAGISFVAGSRPDSLTTRETAKAWGYEAISAYNINLSSTTPSKFRGYRRRMETYQKAWDRYLHSATLPVVLPLTTGWDRTPWLEPNASNVPARSTPQEFSEHAAEALHLLKAQSTPLGRLGVICCWNEYGEGSVLEPTVEFGAEHLKKLRSQINRISSTSSVFQEIK
jgi:hypothetical protein